MRLPPLRTIASAAGLALALLSCGDDEPTRPAQPSLGVSGIGEDKTLGLCVSEPDRATGSFMVRNGSDSRAVITVTANTKEKFLEFENVARVEVMPHAIANVEVVAPVSVRHLRLNGTWDDGWRLDGEIEPRVTVDESLLDIEPAPDSPIGGKIAKLLVRNRSQLEVQFDVELDRALAFDEDTFLVRRLRPGSETTFEVRIVDTERGAKLWYEPAVRLRGDSCKQGVTAPRVTALSPFELRRAERVAAGHAHTCVLATDGGVLCWGSNGVGQIGRAPKDALEVVSDPTKVEGLAAVEQIASGESHTCGLSKGEVRCWGDGGSGPVTIALPRPAKKVFAGWRGSCARLDDDRTMCWGQIARTVHAQPTELTGVGLVSEMTLGNERACALADDGALSCWGRAPGNGDPEAPAPVFVSNAIRGIASTEEVTCGLHSGAADIPAGSVVCWGRALTPTAADVTTPKIASTTEEGPVGSLSGGVARICRHGAETRCGFPFAVPVAVATEPVGAIANGANHFCWAIGGRVKCSGKPELVGRQTVEGFVAGFGP